MLCLDTSVELPQLNALIREVRRTPALVHLPIMYLAPGASETTTAMAYASGVDMVVNQVTQRESLEQLWGWASTLAREDTAFGAMAQMARSVHLTVPFDSPRRSRVAELCGAVVMASTIQRQALSAALGWPAYDCVEDCLAQATAAHGVRTPQVLLLDDASAGMLGKTARAPQHDWSSLLCLFVVTGNGVEQTGGSELGGLPERAFSGAQVHLLAPSLRPQQLAAQVQSVVARLWWRRSCQALLQQGLDQALKDPLTGLFTRRHLDSVLPRELEAARRNSQPLGVLAVDLLSFKAVNDTYGHAAGDQVLQAVGEVLKSQVRRRDTGFRTGGDEFLVLLPGADEDETARVQARLLRALEDSSVQVTPEQCLAPRATVAWFVAAADDWTLTSEALLKKADDQLYRLKRAGA